ncbi:hypothetical protein V6N11_018794 [Hibiscus sabdariffa]|uniref:Uncharacterized protein n=1 Tax=Hibiscus sabdariffa TaxID=183260 RepID=A0ABR2QTB6_9ROSI
MVGQTSNSTKRLPARFDNPATRECYDRVEAAKHIWEEQGFKFYDDLDFYGLKMVIYQILFDQGWLKFDRHPARANLNWVREFYALNATGENTMVNVRGKLVPTDAAAINSILDLPNDEASIYDLIGALENIDYNTIGSCDVVLYIIAKVQVCTAIKL